jgi:hypothetical protein
MATAASVHEPDNNMPAQGDYFRPDAVEYPSDFDDVTDLDDPTIVLPSSIDIQRTFPLINQILPFEACLYHAILPLYIQDDELYLGMVDLEDGEAMAYVRRMLGFLKYQLVPQTISSETHHQVLSAYLSYQSRLEDTPALPEHSSFGTQARTNLATPSIATADASESPTLRLSSDTAVDPIQHRDSVIPADAVDDTPTAPGTLQLPLQDVLTDWNIDRSSGTPVADQAIQQEDAVQLAGSSDSTGSVDTASGADNFAQTTHIQEIPVNTSTIEHESAFELPGSALPELVLQTPPLGQNWRALSGKVFVHGLLIRMMGSGVGRLFIVPNIDGGQVVWTENGVAKMVLEPVALDQLRGVIDELKQLTYLPLETVQQPVEVELERFYQQQRILLRLRIAPKETGETATIQVLRGAALKFYQKQQVHSLRRDTKLIAEQLRQKVLALGRRSQQGAIDRSTLPEIDRTIASLEEQLTQLKHLRHSLKGNSPDITEDGSIG